MSDFIIVSKGEEVSPCYGLESFHITKKEIDALLAGKKLYSTVNCDEYAITIELAESDRLPLLRKFEEIIVEYPPAELCTYPEYRGKPYFSIKYEENGEHFIGFGTYKPEVLSEYLREYFIAPTIIEKE